MISILVAWVLSLTGGIFIGKIEIKKICDGDIAALDNCIASLEWNASLYDFIFVGIFNKKYFISSQYSPWLCHYLGPLRNQ